MSTSMATEASLARSTPNLTAVKPSLATSTIQRVNTPPPTTSIVVPTSLNTNTGRLTSATQASLTKNQRANH